MIEIGIEKTLKDFALLQYALMERSGYCGDFQFDQIRNDFARCLLGLPPERPLYYFDLDKFNLLLEKERTKHSPQSDSTLLASRGPVFIIDGIEYRSHQLNEINLQLEQAGSIKRVFGGIRKEGLNLLLFGPATEREVEGYRLHVLIKEEARTPAAALSIMAFTASDNSIVIRQEAVEYCFWALWKREQPLDPIRRCCLALYGVENLQELEVVKETIVKEMIELTAIHEIAHNKICQTFPDKDVFALGKIMEAIMPGNDLELLNELVVDWLPGGVFSYLADLAKTQYQRARRMLLLYLIINDFNPNSQLFQLRNLVLADLSPYLQADHEINFSAMLSAAPNNYQKYLGRLVMVIQKAKDVIECATYEWQGLKTDFTNLAQAQRRAFLSQGQKYDQNSLIYKRYFWANMLNYLKHGSPANYDLISNFSTSVNG